jgi:23S rRNA (cytosine1962-C5)-methyltransferase
MANSCPDRTRTAAGAGITTAGAARWLAAGWGDVRFSAQCTPFRHLGFFPDMAPVWDWMGERLGGQRPSRHAQPVRLYRGRHAGACLAMRPGHPCRCSKKSVAQARANAGLSGMEDRPVRWIVDDAAKFAAREVRRGRRYDGIILDPPKFGRGPEGEVWRLEEHLPGLVADCRSCSTRRAASCSSRSMPCACPRWPGRACSPKSSRSARRDRTWRSGGARGAGRRQARLLPTAIFARWRQLTG